jgi:decaprenyl-phosphate phosphoribosyltransferase
VIKALVKEARPKQWAKNVLVFAAPGAAGVLDNGRSLANTLIMFVAFCMASSGGYFWNDILGVESDRLHPVKRFRPVASGAVPLPIAKVVGTVLLLGGPALAFTTRWQAGLICCAYVGLTATYSAIWKHIAVLDLVAVASGYVLRAIAGAVAVDVPMSSWFILCITFGSLFVISGKRYAELRELGLNSGTIRATLDEYSVGYLRIVLSISCASTLVAYCVWAFEAKEASTSSYPIYQLSIVPMLTALLRYLLVLEQGHGAAPEEIFFADRTLQVLGLAWIAVFAVGVYAK